jgi:hypothetical protein
MKNINPDIRCPVRDLKPGLPEHEAEPPIFVTLFLSSDVSPRDQEHKKAVFENNRD